MGTLQLCKKLWTWFATILFQNRCRSLARIETLLARLPPHSEHGREV